MMAYSRILCISPALVPIADSEAFCTAKMALALMRDGIDVRSLYMARHDPWLVERHEKSGVWDPVLRSSVGVEPPPQRNPVASIIPTLRYVTDAWGRWIGRVVQKAVTLHRDTPFDIVYSRSLPAFSHVAGFWVSKKLKTPWIANINDPWDFHLFPGVHWKTTVVHRIASRIWLRKTLRAADLVTYPSSGLRDFTEDQAGVRRRSSVVPHIGWRGNNTSSSNLFTLIHTGKTGVNEVTGRSALGFLNGLQRFFARHAEAKSMTKVFFVGPSDPQTELVIEQMGLKSAVISTGWVGYEESLRHIGGASACILIEGKMDRGIYLPSKLPDYIVSEKPILAISPAIGTIADLANEGKGIIRCDGEDEEGVGGAIADLYSAFRAGNLGVFKPDAEMVDKFRAETVSSLFQELVSDAVDRRSKDCSRGGRHDEER